MVTLPPVGTWIVKILFCLTMDSEAVKEIKDLISSKFEQLSLEVTAVKEDNKRFGARLKALESDKGAPVPDGKEKVNEGDQNLNTQEGGVKFKVKSDSDPQVQASGISIDSQGSTTSIKDSCTVQKEFNAIRNALQRVKLPNDLVVADNRRQGVSRKDQIRMNVVAECAKYVETSLKLLSTIQSAGEISEGDIQDLITVQIAQVRYLQEEHSLILVNNSFGDGVEKIYRNLRKHPTHFPPDAIDALQAAVTLNSHQQTSEPRGRGRGSYSFRGGRGGRGSRPYYQLSGGNRIPNTRSQDTSQGAGASSFQDH